MDANRFDTLTRSLGAPASRRAALGATLAGGLLGALGLARTIPEARAAQRGSCTLSFSANVRLGPSVSQPLAAGEQAGALRGELSFDLDQGGRLENGVLQLPTGEAFPVVGQATGHALQARIELAPRRAMVLVGVGEREVTACEGAIDGMATGPEVGDLGDWHAAAAAQAGGGDGNQRAADGTARGGGRDRSSRRADRGGGGGSTGGGDAAGGGSSGGGSSGRSSGGTQGGGRGGSAGGGGSSSGGGTGGAQGGSGDGSTTGSVANEPSCPPGETYCAYVEECRNLLTSPLDCGACATRCPSLVCQEGRCLSEEEADSGGSTGVECDPGETDCDGRCAYLPTDPNDCGVCGNKCDFSVASCVDGTCVFRPGETCPTGQIQCGAICVDPTGDPANCSACGIVCPAGEECRGSLCVPIGGGGGCKTGFVPCGTTCVDPGSDNANCGGCGNVCTAPARCIIGECVVSEGGGGCKTGLTGCGGVCVDLSADPANCGGCGAACAAGETCQFGTCTATTTEAPPPPTCADQGLIDCFGVCVDLQTDPSHCGFCGEVCPSGQCETGTCIAAVGPAPAEVICPAGQADCGGGCIDIFSDPANCGFCGNVCAADQQCLFGVCVAPPDLEL